VDAAAGVAAGVGVAGGEGAGVGVVEVVDVGPPHAMANAATERRQPCRRRMMPLSASHAPRLTRRRSSQRWPSQGRAPSPSGDAPTKPTCRRLLGASGSQGRVAVLRMIPLRNPQAAGGERLGSGPGSAEVLTMRVHPAALRSVPQRRVAPSALVDDECRYRPRTTTSHAHRKPRHGPGPCECADDQAERAWADPTRRLAVCLGRRPPQQSTLADGYPGVGDGPGYRLTPQG
jgi:hypothetical protein